MKKAGIIILIVGLLISVFTGLNFVTREKVADIGKVEIHANKNHPLSWSPVVGVVMMAIGADIYLLGQKRMIMYSLWNIQKKQNMKNIAELKGTWNEAKGKLKQKFAMLTESDVLFIEGKQDELLGRLQLKLGKTKEEIRKIIGEL